MIKLGIIGYSKYNGHPYSFSGIINGIDKSYFKNHAKWPFIYNYLLRNNKNLGFKKMKVTHIWTQNLKLTKNIAKSCLIQKICKKPSEMLNEIDGVIIARDDWKSHKKLSIPFLKRKIPTFIDKPLSLEKKELDFFKSYLKKGILMSCSGLRYSQKIKNKNYILKKTGKINSIKMLVVNDFEKYGVHMLDLINQIMRINFKKIIKVSKNQDFYKILSNESIPIYLNCLRKVNRIFKISIFGKKGNVHFNINDNFRSFYNTLKKFEKMIISKKNPINYKDTINIMNTIRMGKMSNMSQYREINSV
jgi:hypothetical protein